MKNKTHQHEPTLLTVQLDAPKYMENGKTKTMEAIVLKITNILFAVMDMPPLMNEIISYLRQKTTTNRRTV